MSAQNSGALRAKWDPEGPSLLGGCRSPALVLSTQRTLSPDGKGEGVKMSNAVKTQHCTLENSDVAQPRAGGTHSLGGR